MNNCDKLVEGQIYYLSNKESHYDENIGEKIGELQQYTKVVLYLDDMPECYFKILDGEFAGDKFMWHFEEDCATPDLLLTENEYKKIISINTELSFEDKVDSFRDSLTEHQKSEFEDILSMIAQRFYDSPLK